MSKSIFALRRLALPISLVLVGATGAYAAYTSEPTQLILNDVSAVMSSTNVGDISSPGEPAIQTSQSVYLKDGSKIGAIRAIIRDGDAPKTVYVGGDSYPASDFTVEGPRLMLNQEIVRSVSLDLGEVDL